MSILSRNALKAEFISGTAATESKFGDLFDSSYNKNDDSVILGPTGITGSYGLWFNTIGATPVSLSATGATGQIAASSEGFWVCVAQNTWILLPTNPPIGGTVTGHLVPETDVTYDLGATGYRFRDLYISGTTIYMGNSRMSTDDQGNFIFSGPTGGTTIIGPSGQGSIGGTVTSPLIFDGGSQIRSSANSSGDGNGYSTMILKPDASLNSDQYIILDPTAPNHIHIRAGGTAGQSTSDLYLGGETANIIVSDYGYVVMKNESLRNVDDITMTPGNQFSTAEWTNNGGNQQIVFNDPTQDLDNFVLSLNSSSFIEIYDGSNYYSDFTWIQSTTGAGPTIITVSYGGPGPTGPINLNSVYIQLRELRLVSVEIDGPDVDIRAADDLRMYGYDVVRLANYSDEQPVEIISSYYNNYKVWSFRPDGTIEYPDGSTQSSAYPGPNPNEVLLTYGPGPTGPTAPGATGQMILETVLGASPELGYLYIYDPTNSRWVKFTGAAWDW
jgi:hypothetical protein